MNISGDAIMSNSEVLNNQVQKEKEDKTGDPSKKNTHGKNIQEDEKKEEKVWNGKEQNLERDGRGI